MKKDNELCSYKSNRLIQDYVWNLKQYELKLFEFLCCCYDTKYYDGEKNEITVSLSDLSKECNVPEMLNGGTYYIRFKSALKKLADTSIWVLEGNKEILIRMINKIIIEKKKGLVICQMSEDYENSMQKHITGNAFVELKIINSFSSKYSINLYNLIRSWDGKEEVVFSIDYLRKKLLLTAKTYNNITQFTKVIDNAVEEINDYSPLKVSYERRKEKGVISDFVFYIDKDTEDITVSIDIVNKQIDYERLKEEFMNNDYIKEMRDIIYEIMSDEDTKEISILQGKKTIKQLKSTFEFLRYNNICAIYYRINDMVCSSNGSCIQNLKQYLITALYNEGLQAKEYEEYKNNLSKAGVEI